MPLNVRRIFASFFLVVFGIIFTYSQTTPAPTAAEVMRQRVSKAKAYIVLKNYNAAIYELENIRRETNDPNIHAMLNVLLMHSYLEQADYKRAQALLENLHKDLKAKKPNAVTNYYAVTGQIIKGAKTQLERYRSIGLSVADRNLPLEAVTDIENMRQTLETVVEQTKALGVDKTQTDIALPLLEEATNARAALAKDDYDANHWKKSVADAREMLINSRSTIINAVDGTPETPAQNTAAAGSTVSILVANTKPNDTAKTTETLPNFQPVTNPASTKPSADTTAKIEKPAEKIESPKEEIKKEEVKKPNDAQARNETVAQNAPLQPTRDRLVETAEETSKKEEIKNDSQTVAAPAETPKNSSPVAVGSLIEYATHRVNPVYPVTAKSLRLTGIVRIDILIDEEGKVAEIKNTDGHSMLQRSALDAIKKWQFKPFTRDGQPVKAAGFVSFNFSL